MKVAAVDQPIRQSHQQSGPVCSKLSLVVPNSHSFSHSVVTHRPLCPPFLATQGKKLEARAAQASEEEDAGREGLLPLQSMGCRSLHQFLETAPGGKVL